MRNARIALIAVICMLLMPMVCIQEMDADDTEVHPAYDTLSDRQKALYDSLCKGVPKYARSIQVQSLTLDDADTAMFAFMSDHPEYFWFKDAYSMYYYPETGMATEVKLVTTLDTKKLDSMRESLSAIAGTFSPSGTSYVEKVRSIHDWLIKRISYDLTTENSGNVYGALVEGKVRCEGYSYALNYMCSMHGIPSIYISGDVRGEEARHAWNIVLMDDGKWYYVDLTWDDPRSPISVEYDYFLIGSETSTPTGKFSVVRHADYDYGIDVSATAYPYYPDVSDTDFISLSYDTVLSNSFSPSTLRLYYTILDTELYFTQQSMRTLAREMQSGGYEYWSVVITKADLDSMPDAISASQYQIRMFLDSEEMTLSEADLQKEFEIHFPATDRPLLHITKIYHPDGTFIQTGNEYKLEEVGSYVVTTEKNPLFSLQNLLILIAVLILLGGLILYRRHRRYKRVKKMLDSGYVTEAGSRRCIQCGSRLSNDDAFCKKCGCPVGRKKE